jgi:membrane protein YdbS with pleckstrin-like domain
LSFGGFKVFNGIEQALVLALMLVTMVTLFYVEMDLTYKIGVAALSFVVIFLATLATAMLRQQREIRQQQMKQA